MEKNNDTEALGTAVMDAWKVDIGKSENESVFDYVDRMLNAMMGNLHVKGITVAFTSATGNHFITSKGQTAPIRLINHGEWNELDGDL